MLQRMALPSTYIDSHYRTFELRYEYGNYSNFASMNHAFTPQNLTSECEKWLRMLVDDKGFAA